MARTGRPPIADPRRHLHNVRLTDSEHALLLAAATRDGTSISLWMRTEALAKARQLAKKV